MAAERGATVAAMDEDAKMQWAASKLDSKQKSAYQVLKTHATGGHATSSSSFLQRGIQ